LNVDLSHRTILVTGAAQGLGLGIAQRLASAGARLVLSDCNPKVMDELANPIFASSAIAFVHDLEDSRAAHDLMRSALATAGHVDGLVNCAGLSFHKPFSETTVADFDRVIAINQRAPYFLSQEFAKALPADTTDACIVNIASVNAGIGNRNLTAYASTKGALLAMSRAMAVELAPRIRVATISPGAVLTKYTEELIARGEINIQHLFSRQLLQSFISVDEIGDLVVFLFGPSGRSVTGSNWIIDAGVTAQ
jgi:NAD(P)-dependent dehydrogenase (short-subunit alcohol dehydrogenase family)